MQKKESNNLDQELNDKVIRMAYGDAGIVERLCIYFKALSNKEVKKILEEFKHTSYAVHNIKQEDAPEQLINAVKINTSDKRQSESFISSLSYTFFMFFGKRAIPATVLIIILVLLFSFIFFKEPAPTHNYSKAQIELAEKQFRQSMAIVGEAFQNAEKSFSDEVMNKQVNKNLNRGYYLVNNILTGG